jgi:Fe-Mn family superoxide dismutase
MFVLPDLPYGYGALAPVISERTMRFHHDKHHGTYVKTTNELVEAAKASPASLEDVIRGARSAGDTKLFNNAAQAWNHGFFWEAMAPSGAKPDGKLAAAIKDAFGDLGALKTQFVKDGAEHFGSGWVWLLDDRDRKLKVRATHDAEDMVTNPGQTPLIVCDLWEHAYYLDHQNDRKGFLEAWFDALPNWSFAARQLEAAASGNGGWKYPPPETASTARVAAHG